MKPDTKANPPIRDRVRAFMQSLALHQGDVIVTAVSGGADSIVLLHILNRLKDELNIVLYAAHLEHGLRGQASLDDAAFVAAVCKEWSIPLVSESVDVATWCKQERVSTETGARQCRYAFFERTKQQLNARYVATAHNANDNAETILDRLLRGSGWRGLGGIPAMRDVYIRPLLDTSRDEIESWAQLHNLAFCTDATNTDQRYKRNRIRHTLLPMLEKEFNPQMIATLNRTAKVMQQAEQFINSQAQLAFSQCVRHQEPGKIVLDISQFFTYLLVLQVEILMIALHNLGDNKSNPGFEQYGNLDRFLQKQQSGASFQWTPSTRLTFSGNDLVIWQPPGPQSVITLHREPGVINIWQRYILEIKESVKPLEIENLNRYVEWVDAEKLTAPLCIRPVATGDRFYPVNMTGSKKVSDYFIDTKVPVHERELIPVLESKGRIVWICGHRLDDRFKITEQTRHCLRLELKNL